MSIEQPSLDDDRVEELDEEPPAPAPTLDPEERVEEPEDIDPEAPADTVG